MAEKQKSPKRGRRPRDSTDIAWQNKDIISKLFGESLKGKSLSLYGIRKSEITDVRPTNMPAIEANELRLDNLFLMEDGAYAIVDYESAYSEENKLKYLGYIARVSKRLYTEFGELKPLRMIVIYTADVEPGSTDPNIDLGSLHMRIEEAFLIGKDSAGIKEELTNKVARKESFTDEDIMKLIIYPLTYKGTEAKQRAVSEAIDIADQIKEEKVQRSALSGIFVFADKIITDEDASRITRRLDMTKVGRILQEREDKAVADAVAKTEKKVKKEAKEDKKQSAIKLLKTGDSVEKVSECMGLTMKEVQALAAKI